MFNFAILNSALQKALKAIGNEGEHACPKSQDPLDQVLHNYYVAKLGEKFFTDKAELAKADMLAKIGPEAHKVINDMIASTKANDAGEAAVVIDAQHYNLDLTTRKGAKRMDSTKLSTILQVDYSMPASVVEEIISKASPQSEPTKIFTVKPVRE